jgi:GT2 family glycosyltransferase
VNLPTISIIIVNWNTQDILKGCLESIYAHPPGFACEVIVVDNGSSDGSPQMVEAGFPQVVLVKNPENRGFAAANNQGIAIAKGSRYVLLLNSDTVVLEGALDKTVAFADAHRDGAVVGCRVLNADGSLQPTCFRFPSVLNMVLGTSHLSKLFPHSRFLGRENMAWWDRTSVREVEVVTGCFMLVRREAITQVGMMDERFFMYGEETDWCYRFRQAGWKILFTPEGQIIHYGGASARQNPSNMSLQLRQSVLFFMKKHHTLPAYVSARVLIGFFFLLRIPYWLMIAPLVTGNREGAWRAAKTYTRGAVRCFTGRGLCSGR